MSFKDLTRKVLKKTGEKILTAADHVDETGGELRDRLLEKVRTSRGLERLRASIGSTKATVSLSPEPSQTKSAPANAPSPVPRPPVEKFSYGDSRKPVQIFGTRTCPWSSRALFLLERAGIKATYVDLNHPSSGPMREELRVETGHMTVPYIYVRGTFIGGYNELDEIYRLGQLDYYVLPESARAQHPDHGRFEITPRRRDAEID